MIKLSSHIIRGLLLVLLFFYHAFTWSNHIMDQNNTKTVWYQHPNFSTDFQEKATQYLAALHLGQWIAQHQDQYPQLAALGTRCQQLEAPFKAYFEACEVPYPTQLLKANLSSPTDKTTEDIGKKTFVKYVLDWIASLKSALGHCTRTDLEVSVLNAQTTFNSHIHNGKFPISQILLSRYITPSLQSLGEQATPKAIAEALTNALTDFEQFMSDQFEQTKHYKENKEDYRQIKKAELEGQLMTEAEFNAWLKEALGKAELEQKEEEGKAAASREQFEKEYQAWQAQSASIVRSIVESKAMDSSIMISKPVFAALLLDVVHTWALKQPELAEDLRKNIVANLPPGDSAPVLSYQNGLINALKHIPTEPDLIYERWKKDRALPSFTTLYGAIFESMMGVNAYTIIGEYLEWNKVVGDAIYTASFVPNQQYVLKQIDPAFKPLMQGAELGLFYKTWLSHVEAYSKPLPTKDDLHRSWLKTIRQLVQQQGPFKAHLQKLAAQYPDKESAQTLNRRLLGQCSKDSIQMALKTCQRPIRKAPKLGKGKSIAFELVLSDGTILQHTIFTGFDRVENEVLALPQKASVQAASGSEGYSFGLVDYVDQSPVVVGKGEGYVDLAYKVIFSKDKGSIEAATSREQAYSQGLEQGVGQYQSSTQEQGQEETHGEQQTKGGSNAISVEGDAKLFGVGVEIGDQFTLYGENSSTHDQSTYFATSEEKGRSVEWRQSQNLTQSQGQSQSVTVNQGKQTGFFSFQLRLKTTDSVPDGTLNATLEWLAPPQAARSQGLSIEQRNSMPVVGMNWAQ